MNPFVNRAKLCEAPIPPCRESFFAGMRHCSLAVLCDDFGGQRLVAIKFPNHPSIYGMSIHPEKHTDVQLCSTKCIPALITEHQINCHVPRTRAEAAEAAEASRRRRAETLLSALVSRSLMKAALRAEDGLRGNNLEGP